MPSYVRIAVTLVCTAIEDGFCYAVFATMLNGEETYSYIVQSVDENGGGQYIDYETSGTRDELIELWKKRHGRGHQTFDS